MLINDYQTQQKSSQSRFYVNDETNEILEAISPEETVPQSALIVPLKIGGVVTGVIQVMSYRRNAYTENQLNLLEAMALHIASAEQNAMLYAQAQKVRLTGRTQIDLAHARSRLGEDIDQALLLQAHQSIAHRCLTHAVLRRKCVTG